MITSKRNLPALFCALTLAACGSADKNDKSRSGTGGESPVYIAQEAGTDGLPSGDVRAAPTVGDLLPEPLDVIWRTWLGDFSGMVDRRVIRAVVPYGGYQFYYESGMPRGAVYELLRRFEDEINSDLERRNVRVHVAVIPVSREQLLPALLEGHADIVAGDLTMTEARRQIVEFTRPLLEDVREIVVAGPRVDKLETLDDLAGREIHVRRSSSYFEHLETLADDFKARDMEPPVVLPLDELLEAEDILELLDTGVIDLTVLDEYKAEFWTGVFENISLRSDLVINTGGRIGWAMRKDSPELMAVVDGFLREYGRGTLVGNDTYNRHLENAERVRCAERGYNSDRLNAYVDHFRNYGEQYSFDWLMLAAQGLQESQLRQDRKSPAGAIGVMQIKPSTAADKNVAIDDITTAENNIHAGAKYMRFIADRYYDRDAINPLNQWLFSLAAYNAGPARINRFRNEARREGRDPDRWFDNVEIIAARRIGRETVTYVSNVFKYYTSYKLIFERARVFDDRFGELLAACAAND